LPGSRDKADLLVECGDEAARVSGPRSLPPACEIGRNPSSERAWRLLHVQV